MGHKQTIGLKLTFWAITPDVSDDEARAAYALKFGAQPAMVVRNGPIILLGPVNDGK